jgi:hypothetical protein
LQSALCVGVADSVAQAPKHLFIEPLGTQWAYVAPNTTDSPGQVQLELLYKALSVNRQAVFATIAASRRAQGDRV